MIDRKTLPTGVALLVALAASCGDEQTATETTDAATDAPTSSSGAEAPTSAPGDESSGPAPLLDDGQPCEADSDCASGHCFDTGDTFGAFCGGCSEDADCPQWGCNPPGPRGDGTIAPSACSDGSAGSGCAADDACADGLVCAATGLGLGDGTCGACRTDDDCPDAMLCTPSLDFMTFESGTSCVAAGSLADGVLCDLEGSGDDACANLCAETASPFGVVGVCSACETDGDCPEGQACTTASLGMTGGTPGRCE